MDAWVQRSIKDWSGLAKRPHNDLSNRIGVANCFIDNGDSRLTPDAEGWSLERFTLSGLSLLLSFGSGSASPCSIPAYTLPVVAPNGSSLMGDPSTATSIISFVFFSFLDAVDGTEIGSGDLRRFRE